MFVKRLQKDNPKFIDAMVRLQQAGKLLPDSYAVDMEQFRANGKAIADSARAKGIKLYFMLKQIGRNPVLAQELVKLGYDGAVVVDFKEAQVMMRHNIPIGNVGHLVQIPEGMVREVVAYGPEVITVYTADKVRSISRESARMKFAPDANAGRAELMHWGADTFMGHQEIMGTLPKVPIAQPFQMKVDETKAHLEAHGHKVEVKQTDGLRYLLVDDYVCVGDNIDADLGMAYNCTAPLDMISFEKELEIGQLVRDVATVNRVIPFGGTGNTIEDVLAAEETREGKYIGIHAVKSKSYRQGYQCLHLGYGVDKTVQAPTILTGAGIPVTLMGKVADVVQNDGGKSISCVPTAEVLDLTIEELKNLDYGFICTNVQETDLAGHSQDSTWYSKLLQISDEKIGKMLPLLGDEDILLVMADHGNDPNIGHNKHTRENVPLLVWRKGVKGVDLGLRKTLSDVGATVCDFFGVPAPQNGESFLALLK